MSHLLNESEVRQLIGLGCTSEHVVIGCSMVPYSTVSGHQGHVRERREAMTAMKAYFEKKHAENVKRNRLDIALAMSLRAQKCAELLDRWAHEPDEARF